MPGTEQVFNNYGMSGWKEELKQGREKGGGEGPGSGRLTADVQLEGVTPHPAAPVQDLTLIGPCVIALKAMDGQGPVVS